LSLVELQKQRQGIGLPLAPEVWFGGLPQMASTQQIVRKANVFLTRSPFLSFQFIASTVTTVICLGLNTYVCISFWEPLGRPAFFGFILLDVYIFGTWLLMLEALRDLRQGGVISEIEAGSVLETVLEDGITGLNKALLNSLLVIGAQSLLLLTVLLKFVHKS
jgi:hypothetical protein